MPSAVVRPAIDPAALRMRMDIHRGGILSNPSRANADRQFSIRTFRGNASIAAVAGSLGKNSSLTARRAKRGRPKRSDRTLADGDLSGDADPAASSRKHDLAFQRAMRSAAARGLEHPPMIGIFKDTRPLNTATTFSPAPHSSGCTSPALICAELEAPRDPSIPCAQSQ